MFKTTRFFHHCKKLTLPDLKFDLHELEPVLSKEAMDLHYNKHHQTYINNYNKFADELLNAQEKENHEEALRLTKLVSFNLGGYYNHAFFWENLSPVKKHGGVLPDKNSKLGQALTKSFGSFDEFKKKFNDKTAAIQGSGWGWLAWDKKSNSLLWSETANQDTLSQVGLTPLLTIDVWEHAYYVNYKNMRAKYLEEIWNVMNWKVVEERFNKASAH